jgi:phage shock protein A
MIVWLILVLGLTVAALLYQGRALRRYRREGARLAITGRDLSDRVRLLEQELAALCGASAGAASHLTGLERRVRRIRERQDRLESRAGLRRTHTQVDRPVASGAPNDEADESRDLTRAETELLLMKPRGNA